MTTTYYFDYFYNRKIYAYFSNKNAEIWLFLKSRMLRLCRSTSVQWQQQRGAFVASNAPTNIVKGREDRKLMAPEYISPQNQV